MLRNTFCFIFFVLFSWAGDINLKSQCNLNPCLGIVSMISERPNSCNVFRNIETFLLRLWLDATKPYCSQTFSRISFLLNCSLFFVTIKTITSRPIQEGLSLYYRSLKLAILHCNEPNSQVSNSLHIAPALIFCLL